MGAIDRLEAIPSPAAPSPAAARAYEEAREELVNHVNRALTPAAQGEGLIGDAKIRVMYDNHRNHAMFVSQVMAMGQMNLLRKLIPWAYRVYTSRGFTARYFPMAFSAWRAAVDALLPEAHAADVGRIYDWLLDNDKEFMQLREIPFVPLATTPSRSLLRLDRFRTALLGGNLKRALEVARESMDGDLLAFYEEVVQPALYGIGELWERGEINAAREHLASAIAARAITAQYLGFGTPEARRGKAVVSTVANEFHEVGAWMVANALEQDGWEVRYLGANTPNADLLALLVEERPDLVALSVAMPFNIRSAHRSIESIRAQEELAGLPILLGGLAFSLVEEVPRALGADGWAASCRGAVQEARRVTA